MSSFELCFLVFTDFVTAAALSRTRSVSCFIAFSWIGAVNGSGFGIFWGLRLVGRCAKRVFKLNSRDFRTRTRNTARPAALPAAPRYGRAGARSSRAGRRDGDALGSSAPRAAPGLSPVWGDPPCLKGSRQGLRAPGPPEPSPGRAPTPARRPARAAPRAAPRALRRPAPLVCDWPGRSPCRRRLVLAARLICMRRCWARGGAAAEKLRRSRLRAPGPARSAAASAPSADPARAGHG